MAAEAGARASRRAELLLTAGGVAALYIPTFYDLSRTLWRQDDYAHGPIILLVVCWILWQRREILWRTPSGGGAVTGGVLFFLGLVCYALGRSQRILQLEVGSLILVLSGSALLLLGSSSLRALRFPLVFLVFLVPLPGVLVDAVTGKLKAYVSYIAEAVLYTSGYPVARDGVMLTVGQYQLLVADACSGLHSMFSLVALGMLYIHVSGEKSWIRNAVLLTTAIPIAFVVNIIRVIVLVLITYHLGDEAGQGFLHDWAGLLLFVAALGLFIASDGLIRLVHGSSRQPLPRS